MVKKSNAKKILVILLLLFIGMVMFNKNRTEGYVAAPRVRARIRADAKTYTGPGDAFRGPVAPGRRARRVVWYNPTTWWY